MKKNITLQQKTRSFVVYWQQSDELTISRPFLITEQIIVA